MRKSGRHTGASPREHSSEQGSGGVVSVGWGGGWRKRGVRMRLATLSVAHMHTSKCSSTLNTGSRAVGGGVSGMRSFNTTHVCPPSQQTSSKFWA